jgi:hypothetical protein
MASDSRTSAWLVSALSRCRDTVVIRRKTNCRHMISDHHGRVTDIATSLLTATDEILCAHSVNESPEPTAQGNDGFLERCRFIARIVPP